MDRCDRAPPAYRRLPAGPEGGVDLFQTFLAVLAALAAAALLALLLIRPAAGLLADAVLRRLLRDPYPENLAEMLNVIKKTGGQEVFELEQRAETGLPLRRPFGSPRHFSDWERLLFNPVYLTRPPLEEEAQVSTVVTLGPRAARPLVLEMPVMIGGMAFGIGLARPVKLALAKASTMAGTAANTGVGPFLAEEREAARRLILQYHRGAWGKDEETLRQADAVEIQLGYGALGAAPVRLAPGEISDDLRQALSLGRNESLNLLAGLPGVTDAAGLAALVARLRRVTGGVPIGVKIGATHWLEDELDVIVSADPDYLAVDGAEAGINYSPGILADDLGLPTLPALRRAAAYLESRGLRGRISLVVSGGLHTPGRMLKALALGADAVYVGTAMVLSLTHTQTAGVLPWEPPTEAVYGKGKSAGNFDAEEGARTAANYLASCRAEMVLALRAMGRTSLGELTAGDLCALTPEMAALAGVESAWQPAGWEGRMRGRRPRRPVPLGMCVARVNRRPGVEITGSLVRS